MQLRRKPEAGGTLALAQLDLYVPDVARLSFMACVRHRLLFKKSSRTSACFCCTHVFSVDCLVRKLSARGECVFPEFYRALKNSRFSTLSSDETRKCSFISEHLSSEASFSGAMEACQFYLAFME